ncbi:MAG: hypothetical protein IKU34_04845 [Clostridia bacterium]|nr:hypothetical protein [Clostridia bacterium]
MRKSFSCAGAAYAAMCTLVGLYGAAVLTLMCGRIAALPLCLLAGGGFAAGLALLGAKNKPTGFAAPASPHPFSARVFLAAAGFSLLVSCVYLFAYFPGGVSSDTVTQWQQIRGAMPLNDWHPALHTLLLGLLARICDHPAFVLFVQGVLYACAVGYAASSLNRWRMPAPFTAATALLLSANPALSNIMAFPWKDCAFAIAALFLAVQCFEIHCSGGGWLRGWLRPCLLALTLALCAILRHNGIALSLAAGVWLVISLPGLRKRAAMAALLSAALFVLIKGPLYSAAGVKKNVTPLDETIGLPMVVLSHIYVNAPESLDAETVAFLEAMAPRDVYAAHHRPGDWNETKWFVSSLPEESGYTLAQVFSFAAKAALAQPSLALTALGGLFDLPLLPAGSAFWRMSPYVDPSAASLGFVSSRSEFLARALNWLCRLTASPALSWLLWRPGTVLLFIMAACVLFARRRPLTALLLPAGLIAYHLATALMLSSPTDFRFFLPTMVTAPLAIAALMMTPAE